MRPSFALIAERARRTFSSIEDLKLRVPLNKEELRTLAEIGALNGLAEHRRAALWEAERKVAADDLFAFREESQSPLLPMNGMERLQSDYQGMSLTTGLHPMALLREQLPDVWRAVDLPQARDGQTVRIAGNVICRQRPGTAKGFVFISLEDETGISNAIVAPGLFEKLRLVITSEPYLMIEGRLQNKENVILIQARRIERLPHGDLSGSSSYDFH